MSNNLSSGTVHQLPSDLRQALRSDKKVPALWESLTPLARNEFICWVENAKQAETRTRRITRTVDELLEGERRPCCWMGCIHRTDKPVSPSVRGILAKRSKNNISQ